jgi:hypothetical protein
MAISGSAYVTHLRPLLVLRKVVQQKDVQQ